MINVSNEFKQNMLDDNRDFQVYIDITLRDGTVLNLDNSSLWENSLKISDGVSTSGKFTIGSCIINKLTFTLNNIYDEFSIYDFDRAEVVVHMALQLENRVEKIRKGVFIVDDPQYNGSTITLECLDYMSKLDVDYKEVKTTYPATLEQIVRDICNFCGITLLTVTFDNGKYVVNKRPDNDALTCRQVLAYCAQISCKWARCDTYGRIELKWYEQGIFEKNDNLDGGIFDDAAPYESGDMADGGDFDNYSDGDVIDAGTFDDLNHFHHLYSMSSFTVSTDDVVITGIQVTEDFAETEKEKCNTVLNGTEGYVLDISGNKFIEKGRAEEVAAYLAGKLVGLRFRVMSTEVLSDPTVEAGDLAYVTDRKQNTYNCLITNLTFNLGGHMSVSCDAETPGKNSTKQYSELTKAMVQARKNAQAQIDEYNLAVQQLTNLITNSFGVFKTEEILDDGSTIYYMHDKPTLEESKTIWKMTADAFAVSTDGGKTWNAGMDAKGNAVVNVLSAIGINCDWIHAGTLTLGGYNNENGKLVMQDAGGNIQGRWDNRGVHTTGSITSDAKETNYRAVMDDGKFMTYDKFGNLCGVYMNWWSYDANGKRTGSGGGISGKLNIIGTSNEAYVYTMKDTKEACISGDTVIIKANKLGVGNTGSEYWWTKSGQAVFSDGSYLNFKNGMLIGGRTAGGGTI